MPPMAARVAERTLLAMAYKRQDFVNKVQEHVGGALLEFYKAQCAAKNGQTRWVQHWRSAVKTLLDRNLVATLLHPIRGFTNRRLAFDRAVAELELADEGYRTTAQNTVLRDYGLKKLKVKLDDSDTKAFWQRVESAVKTVLP